MAKSCTKFATATVRTQQGALDVCEEHETCLRESGEITDPRPLVRIATGQAIVKPNGRPPIHIPAATLSEAESRIATGEPLKAVARAVGVESNTLRRRLAAPKAAPVEPPTEAAAPERQTPAIEDDALSVAGFKLSTAKQRRQRAAALRAQADELDAEAVKLIAEARAALEGLC